MHLNKDIEKLIGSWSAYNGEVPGHLEETFSHLVIEHPSGIPPEQLTTPMMKQFAAVKEEVPDALVFFRMGDFFELFGVDAIIASEVCALTLTSRDKNSSKPVAMAGVPVVAYLNALKKLVSAGFKVVVCDQVEDPKHAKGIVKREITRIATPAVPGELTDDVQSADNEDKGCYLASVLSAKEGYTLAYVDVSTGVFKITGPLDMPNLEQEILTVAPKEILVPQSDHDSFRKRLLNLFHYIPAVNIIEPWLLRSEKHCHSLLKEFFGEGSFHKFSLEFIPQSLYVCGSILHYLKQTQRGIMENLTHIESYTLSDFLLLDDSTKRHLDFFVTATGEKKGSLYWFLNQCQTPMGARALAHRLHYPFKNSKDISIKQSQVAECVDSPSLLSDLQERLRYCADIDRLLSRTATGALDPKGAVLLRESLKVLGLIRQTLLEEEKNSELQKLAAQVKVHLVLAPLLRFLDEALLDEPSGIPGRNGNLFKPGYNSEFDELNHISANVDSLMKNLESREKERTGINTLKIGYSRVFGYFFEVSKGKANLVPEDYLRKQTLTNAERFITAELKELEDKMLTASEKRDILEKELFEGLKNEILNYTEAISSASSFLAEIDLLCNFASLANTYSWCRPKFASDAEVTALKQSYHPIIAALNPTEDFIPNDIAVGDLTQLSEDVCQIKKDAPVLLITGPNMAGKSTIMRQLALSQVLFQVGAFLPAEAAVISPCDRIFTRIGSGDKILRGQSTFMVEMLESAHMLRMATSKSLLLMDEIGRGTSTWDGMSLAWAILEDLHNRVKARTLFSTHYHELGDVVATHERILPMQMQVIESSGQRGEEKILFSRRFIEGLAGKSFGLQVARLAGLPEGVLHRAHEKLHELESTHGDSDGAASRRASATQKAQQAAPKEKQGAVASKRASATAVQQEKQASLNREEDAKILRFLKKVENLDVENITPLEALNIMAELKGVAFRKKLLKKLPKAPENPFNSLF